MFFQKDRSDKVGEAYSALEFLREAYQAGRLDQIENMEDVLEALDISQDLEHAKERLRDFHIEE